MSLVLKISIYGGKLSLKGGFLLLMALDEFDSYYVIKISEGFGDKYFFSTRIFVKSIDLAKKFNTLRSAKRSMKLIGDFNCIIEKIKRNNF